MPKGMYDGAKGDALMELGFVDNRDLFGDLISNTTGFRRTLLFPQSSRPNVHRPNHTKGKKNVTLTCTIRPM